MTHSESERIAKLEQRLEGMEADLHKVAATVENLNALLLQAKGARWAILAVIAIGGWLSGSAATWLHKFLP